MTKGRLPEERGPLRIGPVTLPAGRLIMGYFSNQAVAWATDEPVPGSARAWAALSKLHPETGLVPIQLDGVNGDARHPWDFGGFVEPEDPRDADGLDAGALLQDLWDDWVSWPDEDDPYSEAIERRAPFSLDFPGLAPPEHTPLTTAERDKALNEVLPKIRQAHRATAAARIALVAADRPADVLPAIGWDGLAQRGESLLPLTAVLRSWEDRFGARLIDVGSPDLRLFVERPPRSTRAAQRIAAEHVVMADECTGASTTVPTIAARLLNAHLWTFWWD